jgi:hypothetical protein
VKPRPQLKPQCPTGCETFVVQPNGAAKCKKCGHGSSAFTDSKSEPDTRPN